MAAVRLRRSFMVATPGRTPGSVLPTLAAAARAPAVRAAIAGAVAGHDAAAVVARWGVDPATEGPGRGNGGTRTRRRAGRLVADHAHRCRAWLQRVLARVNADRLLAFRREELAGQPPDDVIRDALGIGDLGVLGEAA